MIWAALLCVTFIVTVIVCLVVGYIKGQNEGLKLYDEWCQEDLREAEERNYEKWCWLVSANARRKRMERCLRKQRDLNGDLRTKLLDVGWKLGTALVENTKLKELSESLEKRNRLLASELVDKILIAEDRETVTKGLTRKL